MPRVAKKPNPDLILKKQKRILKQSLKENIARQSASVPKQLEGVAGITMLADGASQSCFKEIPHTDPDIKPELVIRRDSAVIIDLPQLCNEVEHFLFEFAAVIADARVAVRRDRKGSAYMVSKISTAMRAVNGVTERLMISMHQSAKQPNAKKAKA